MPDGATDSKNVWFVSLDGSNKHNFCIRPYVPREPRRDPSNWWLYEHGICFRRCQDSNSQPVPYQVRANSTRPQWRMLIILSRRSRARRSDTPWSWSNSRTIWRRWKISPSGTRWCWPKWLDWSTNRTRTLGPCFCESSSYGHIQEQFDPWRHHRGSGHPQMFRLLLRLARKRSRVLSWYRGDGTIYVSTYYDFLLLVSKGKWVGPPPPLFRADSFLFYFAKAWTESDIVHEPAREPG